MPPADRHPHVDMPSEKELGALIESVRPGHRGLYLAVHRLVVETLPGVRYSVDRTDATIGYGARQFGYDGWGMAALMPHSTWLTLAFFRGAELKDPQRLVEGTGKSVRHVKIRSVEELGVRREAIRCLLQEAARLNEV